MSGHTPGPWLREGYLVYALQHHGWRRGVEQFENRFHAHIETHRTAPADEAESNTRLIAAAPELLDVLREVLSNDDRLMENGRDYLVHRSIFEKAAELIARIEGE